MAAATNHWKTGRFEYRTGYFVYPTFAGAYMNQRGSIHRVDITTGHWTTLYMPAVHRDPSGGYALGYEVA
jgi:hypothetical protein